MERNLDQRVEILVPVLDSALTSALKERLLDLQLSDTVRATELHSDGAYGGVLRSDDSPIDAQLAWAVSPLSFMP